MAKKFKPAPASHKQVVKRLKKRQDKIDEAANVIAKQFVKMAQMEVANGDLTQLSVVALRLLNAAWTDNSLGMPAAINRLICKTAKPAKVKK